MMSFSAKCLNKTLNAAIGILHAISVYIQQAQSYCMGDYSILSQCLVVVMVHVSLPRSSTSNVICNFINICNFCAHHKMAENIKKLFTVKKSLD